LELNTNYPSSVSFHLFMYSLSKLESLLHGKGFVIHKLFHVDGKYKYLWVVHSESASQLLVDLGKYTIDVKHDSRNAFELFPQKFTDEDYNNVPEQLDVDALYKELSHNDMLVESEEKALDLYNKEFSVGKVENRSYDRLKSTYRQIKRLMLPVRGLTYKLAIIESDCFCVIDSKNDVYSFTIKEYTDLSRQIIITVDLQNFVKLEHSHEDSSKLLIQFYDLLNRNQSQQTQKIQEMVNAKKNIVSSSKTLLQRKQNSLVKIMKLQNSFKDVAENERETFRKLRQQQDSGIKDDNTAAYEETLSMCRDKRREIIEELNQLRVSLNHLTLTVDSILFDNMQMLIRISNNFKRLETLCKSK
jgi:hypothetical protein